MLSSESALRDYRQYYPGAANQTSIVRFATQPPPALLTAIPLEVIKRYGLPSKYFYLPNQFYRHKNHQVVIDALTILAKRGVDVVVCASGSTGNPRELRYFENIMRQVESRGLGKNFHHLGMIPLPHVYALLRASTALINPSRFEGWSTTVEEAKSFGVPMILSDIDVHREQAAGAASYFRIDDPTTLADHLLHASQNAEATMLRNLLPQLDERVASFAADFAHTIHRAVQFSLR